MAELVNIRSATQADTGAIRSLVIAGRINPSGLDWRRFVVAYLPDGKVIGCGQIKPHRDGSLEIASLAVKPAWRNRGIARLIVAALVNSNENDLYLMCRSRLRGFYERIGFRVIDEDEMPRYFMRVKKLASLADFLMREGESLLVMKRSA